MKTRSVVGVLAFLSSGLVTMGDDSKIVGGFKLSLRDAPFVASVQYKGAHFCGGALLTLSHVISGCHCLTTVEKGKTHEDVQLRSTVYLTVVVGTENLLATSEGFQQRKIKKIEAHPKCSFVKIMIYDFSIAYLDSPLKESVTVKPFKMASFSKDEYNRNTANLVNSKTTACYVAGWGATSPEIHKANPFIKAARMRVIPERECQRRLGHQNAKFRVHNFEKAAMMCSLPFRRHKNESDCVGDSGGPFFCGSTVHGIVSFGYVCGNWDAPNVYAKVSHAVDWLMSLKLFSDDSGKKALRGRYNNQIGRATCPYCNLVVFASLHLYFTTVNVYQINDL